MPGTTEVIIGLEPGRTMRAALALPPPEVARPVPGIVVLHEVFGLNDDIRSICDRFAANGYAAIAPALYSADSAFVCLTRFMTQMRDRSAPPATLALIAAAHQRLTAEPGVDPRRSAVAGFCMGGGLALVYGAKAGTPVAAVASNYGPVPSDRRLLEGSCPVVGSYGADDRALGDDPARLERWLGELDVPADVKVYEGAAHSFMNRHDSFLFRVLGRFGAGYRDEQAEDAWRRIFAFFATHVARTGG
jgi:carboxymethylenebutenolidase